MAQLSSIEWTDATWNPVTGCTKVSPGCLNCYAERMAKRLKAMGVERYSYGFKVRVHDDLLEMPLKWRNPRVIFVNSMSDLFHEEVPEYFIKNVFEIMNSCPQHTFQILTKRSKRLKELSHKLRWAHNIWMGVSVENTETTYRIKDLEKTDARVKFISCEPLIGPINRMPLKNIDWIIVGGESGPHARVMEKHWAISIRNQCVRQSVPYFFKQWGGTRKKANGRMLEGRTWDEMPSLVQQSEFAERL
jgi:protein gp37